MARPTKRLPRRWRAWPVILLIPLVVVLLWLSSLLEPPPAIDRIRVDNPTNYDITVDVSDGKTPSWLTIGTARRRIISDLSEVLDQGDTWVLRFFAQGHHSEELRLTRRQLERSNWAIRLPQWVDEQLQAKGAPFPP